MSGRPMIDGEPWTEQDDSILIAARRRGETFPRIQQLYFTHRSVNACNTRFSRVTGEQAPQASVVRITLDRADAETGSSKLLRAIVEMCIRNRITLPGASPAHTIALAKNIGVIA